MADAAQVTYEKGKLYDLAIIDVQPDPEQPRKYFDEQALAELKASIAKHGVLQPVLVRQGADGGLLLVSGERRYQAAKLAGCQTIPAVFTDGEPAEISIVENLLRENLTPIEEAEAIDRLKTQHNYLLSDLSAVLGKAASTLSEILSLNKLPEEVKNVCRNDPQGSARHPRGNRQEERRGNDDRPVRQIQGNGFDAGRNSPQTTPSQAGRWRMAAL